MRKTLVFFFLLLCFAGTLFFIGWIQLYVPVGKFGVLSTKTGGVDHIPVSSSQFRWKWERLFPTNSELYIFDLVPHTRTLRLDGVLPSGSMYSEMLEGSPDFSWELSATVVVSLNPSMLPELVEKYHVYEQSGLDSWFDFKIDAILDGAIRACIDDIVKNGDDFLIISTGSVKFQEMIKQKIDSMEFSEFDIIEIQTGRLRFPDLSLYSVASQTYMDYQKRRSSLLAQTAASQANESVVEYLQIERFSRWGEVLTKYPILIDFLAVSRNDAAEVFKALKNVR